ncbi:hypothetical protein AAKU55_005365 [Oxalobacteraceae bacterium GrIS 1.11]
MRRPKWWNALRNELFQRQAKNALFSARWEPKTGLTQDVGRLGGGVKSKCRQIVASPTLGQVGKPQVVPRGTKITNDAVSLEAGRKKGSIKKSRSIFAFLIADIDRAAAEQTSPQKTQAQIVDKAKKKVGDLQGELDAALGREQSLLIELFETRAALNQLTGESILPLRRKGTGAQQK